jgi:uncharacterized CHY-type Zn-finger protein
MAGNKCTLNSENDCLQKYYEFYHNTTDIYKITTKLLQLYYGCTTGLQNYSTYTSLHVTTSLPVTTEFYHNTTDIYKFTTNLLQQYYGCTTGLQNLL